MPALQRSAQAVKRGAQQLRALDVATLTEGVRRFGRSHPVWFVGGAFLTGLAVARLFKAVPVRQPAA